MDDRYLKDRENYQLFIKNKLGNSKLSSFDVCEKMLKEKKVGLIFPCSIVKWMIVVNKMKYLDNFINFVYDEKFEDIKKINGLREIVNIIELLIIEGKLKYLPKIFNLIKKNSSGYDFAQIICLVSNRFFNQNDIHSFFINFIIDFYLDKELYKNILKNDPDFFNILDSAKLCLIKINFE